MTSPDVVRVPVHCPHCANALTLYLADWDASQPPHHTLWRCLFCGADNDAMFPARIALVRKGPHSGDDDPGAG